MAVVLVLVVAAVGCAGSEWFYLALQKLVILLRRQVASDLSRMTIWARLLVVDA